MHARGIGLVTLLLTSCVQYQLTPVTDDEDAPAALAVDPESVDFGGLPRGELAHATVRVDSVGDGMLLVDGVSIGGSNAFRITNPDAIPVNVPSGNWFDVEVEYTASGLQDAGWLEIVSNDATDPQKLVDLLGRLEVPRLVIDPSPLDFGELALYCSETEEVRLINEGEAPLVVDALTTVGAGFEIAVAPELPLTLGAGESAPVQVSFSPLSDGAVDGRLWVSSNDPSTSQSSIVLGNGLSNAMCFPIDEGVEAEFTLAFTTEANFADIAFLVDTTCSMGALADAVAKDYGGIVAALSSTFDNAVYGVATYDDYAYGGLGSGGDGDRPFILRQQMTSDTARVASALDSIDIHFGGDSPESSIEALYQGLTGVGYDQDCDEAFDSSTDVPPFRASGEDPFRGTRAGVENPSLPDTGTLGGFGFRKETLPILVYATDDELRDADDSHYTTPGGCFHDAGSSDVASAAGALGAKLVAVRVNSSNATQAAQMRSLAEATGSYGDLDFDGIEEPLVTSWSSGAGFEDTIVEAIEQLVGSMQFDVVTLAVKAGTDPEGFVQRILPPVYTNVRSGDALSFTVRLMGAVPATSVDETYPIVFQLFGDGYVLEERIVYVQVPGTGP